MMGSLNKSLYLFQVKIKTFITPHRSYECITVIRCLYLKDNNPALWQKLLQLESHCAQRRGSDKYESDRMIIAQFLYRFFKIKETEFSEDDILKICGIIQVNRLLLFFSSSYRIPHSFCPDSWLLQLQSISTETIKKLYSRLVIYRSMDMKFR